MKQGAATARKGTQVVIVDYLQLVPRDDPGAIEQDADQTWLLWRPNKESTDHSDAVASIDIAKNRNVPTGLIELDWNGPTSTFHNPVSPAVSW